MPSTLEQPLWQSYLDLALSGRGPDAVHLVIDELVTGGLDVVSLYEDVLSPAARRVGELWHASEISVADEHFATQLSQHVIATAVAIMPSPEPSGSVVVLACPPGELHDMGVRMLGHTLSAHGHVTHMLGASTPVRDLVRYVERVEATHVGISIATALSIPSAQRAVEALAEATDARVFVGGRAAARYPSVAGALEVTACTTTAETLAFLAAG